MGKGAGKKRFLRLFCYCALRWTSVVQGHRADLNRKGDKALCKIIVQILSCTANPFLQFTHTLIKVRQNTDPGGSCVPRTETWLWGEMSVIRGCGVWRAGSTGSCSQKETQYQDQSQQSKARNKVKMYG